MICPCGVAIASLSHGAWTKQCNCNNKDYMTVLAPTKNDSILFKQLTGTQFTANKDGVYLYRDSLTKY